MRSRKWEVIELEVRNEEAEAESLQVRNLESPGCP